MSYGIAVWNSAGLQILGDNLNLMSMSPWTRNFYGPNSDTTLVVNVGYPLPDKNNALIIVGNSEPVYLVQIVPVSTPGNPQPVVYWHAHIFVSAFFTNTWFDTRIVSY